MDTLNASIARLKTAPEDVTPINDLVTSLGGLEPAERADVVARAEQALSGHAASLAALGRALYLQSFPGCELMGARVVVSALALDPQAAGAVQTLFDAADYFSREEGEGLIDQAIKQVGRDPRLLIAKARWLNGEGSTAEGQRLISEALQEALAALQTAPDDLDLTDTMVLVLRVAEPAARAEAVARAKQALSGHAASLLRLGQGLRAGSSAQWNALGAQVLVAALGADPKIDGGVDALASVLGDLGRETAEPLAEEGLRLTGRDPRLLKAWGMRLAELGDSDQAEDAILDAVRRDNSPSDTAVVVLCTYYWRRRLHNQLSRWLDRLEAVAGKVPVILFWRAALYQQRGQLYAAIPALEEACRDPELDPDLRGDIVETLFTCRRDLGQQRQLAALLDTLEASAENQWKSAQQGKLRVFLWRARAALYFRDASRANLWLQKAGEVRAETDTDPADTIVSDMATQAELALLALERRTSLLRDYSADAASFRYAAANLSDASSRLTLREEAVRRAQSASNGQRCPLYFELGIELAELGRLDSAIEAYRQAYDLWDSPNEDEGFWQYQSYSVHNIAVILEREGKYKDAVDEWRRARSAYDDAAAQTSDPYLAWARSSAYYRLDELDRAYQACLNGLAADSENLELLLRLIELNKEWQGSRGRRSWERTVEPANQAPAPDTDPEESLAWRSRDAIRQVRNLLTARIAASHNAAHYRESAEFLLDKADYRTARSHIQEAIRLDPDNADNHKLMARWHERDGNNREALLEYESALELDPDDLQVKSALGQVQVKLENREAARAGLSQVLQIAPAHVETLIRLADLYTDLGDESDDNAYERAIDLYGQALQYHRDGTGSKFLSTTEMASILYQRGYCQVRLYEATPNTLPSRRLKKALKDFDDCLRIDSSHDKARAAKKKLTMPGEQLRLSWRQRYGPWIVLACALFVIVLAQVRYLTGHLSAASYATITLGGVVLAIAGLVLPELLKLKVGGVELEKSPVEQPHRPTSFNLSR